MFKNRIRNKYIARISLLLIVAIGSMILFYNIFAEEYYINKSEEQIVKNYEQICAMDLSDLKRADKIAMDEMVETGFNISILKDDKMVFTSLNTRRTKRKVRNITKEVYDKYTEVAYAETKKNQIVLRGKKIEKGVEYLIHIDIKIKTLESSIQVFSSFLLWEMIIILIFGVLMAIQMGNTISKPIVYLSNMTKRMKTNQYSGKEDFQFGDDEIGDLAENIIDMYDDISGHINELNNYNYLLKNQNEDLIEFDRRRKEFISKATHELKTPLAIISSQMEMVNLEHPEIVKEYYTSIAEEIGKMSKLIRDMLNSSFYETRDTEKEMEVGNLSELVKNMEAKYHLWMESKQIKFHVEIQEGIRIRMISDQIEQAINNYIINAYEHTRKNGTVKMVLVQKEDKAIITVYNEGENIEDDKLKDIWNGYNQGDKVTNSNVGLGLYIVNDIVKSHKGECYVENQPYGVTFTMEFQIVE